MGEGQAVKLLVQRVEGSLRGQLREVVQVHEQVCRRRVEGSLPLPVASVVGVDGPLVASLVVGGHRHRPPDRKALGLPRGLAACLQPRSLRTPSHAFLLGKVPVAIEDPCTLRRQGARLPGVRGRGKGNERAHLQHLQLLRAHAPQQLAVVPLHRGVLAQALEDGFPVCLVRERLLHLALRPPWRWRRCRLRFRRRPVRAIARPGPHAVRPPFARAPERPSEEGLW
mmetsp:Transcript_81332/g.252783  ORF Transcript_81332/g.252783 Transcript_81332/m.252783 type:complete len:226 (+) Transcript_81332:2658-3335(+)